MFYCNVEHSGNKRSIILASDVWSLAICWVPARTKSKKWAPVFFYLGHIAENDENVMRIDHIWGNIAENDENVMRSNWSCEEPQELLSFSVWVLVNGGLFMIQLRWNDKTMMIRWHDDKTRKELFSFFQFGSHGVWCDDGAFSIWVALLSNVNWWRFHMDKCDIDKLAGDKHENMKLKDVMRTWMAWMADDKYKNRGSINSQQDINQIYVKLKSLNYKKKKILPLIIDFFNVIWFV